MGRVGFLQHRQLPIGASPDGVIGDNGLLEVKCVNTATHRQLGREGRVPARYLPQLRHTLWVSSAAWIDFVSYDDRVPAALQVVVVRVHREALDLPRYQQQALQFLSDVERDVTRTRRADRWTSYDRAAEAW